jgi:hypothetical protein
MTRLLSIGDRIVRRAQSGSFRRRDAGRRARYRPYLEAIEDRVLLAVVNWIGPGAGGDWDIAANWTSKPNLPGVFDTANIPAGVTVMHNLGGVDSINMLNCNGALNIATGSLTIAALSFVNQGLTLIGPAVLRSNGNLNVNNLPFSINGATLTGVGNVTVNAPFLWNGGTMNGTGVLTANRGMAINGNGATETLANGTLANAGNATWNGNGNNLSMVAGARLNNQPGGTFTWNSTGNLSMAIGATLNNVGGAPGGTFTWNSTGNLSMATGATLNNQAGATFTVKSDQQIQDDVNHKAIGIINAGTFQKVAGTGTTTDQVAFNNTGAVNVVSGMLAFDSGNITLGAGSTVTAIGAGADVDFGGGVNLGAGSTVIASDAAGHGGTISFSSGTNAVASLVQINPNGILNFTGGTTSFIGIANVNNGSTVNVAAGATAIFNTNNLIFTPATLIDAGTLESSGAMLVSSALNWTGGTIKGLNAIIVSVLAGATLAISGGNPETLDNAILDNAGTATWSGFGNNLMLNNGAVLKNEGTFSVQNDQMISSGTAGSVVNTGTFTKNTTTRTTTVLVTFANTFVNINTPGRVTVSTGTLALDGGGTSTGSFTAGAGATLDFGGSVTLQPVSSVTGSGSVSFSSGTNLDKGSLAITGPGGLSFSGGSITTFTGTMTTGGATVTIAAATANFNTNLRATTIDLNNGTLGGSGVVSVSSALYWTGGTINGTGSVTVQPRAKLAISGANKSEVLEYDTLNNLGTATWSGNNNNVLMVSGSGAMLNNQAGATFNVQNDQAIELLSLGLAGAAPKFNNAGTLTKTATANTTAIDVAFSNTGTLAVQDGTVSISGAVDQIANNTLSAGKWEVFGSSNVNSTLTITAAGETITTIGGSATVELSGLNTSFTNISGLTTNQGSFLVLGGQTFTTTGDFSNSGNLTLGPASTLSVGGNFTESSTAKLTLQIGGTNAIPTIGSITATGTISLDGGLALSGTIKPAINTVFTVVNNTGISAVSGTFTGLSEGATFTFNGMTFTISYVGGPAGQDVTLTRTA